MNNLFYRYLRTKLNLDELRQYSLLSSGCSAVRLNECSKLQIWVTDSRMFEFQYRMIKKYYGVK